MAAAALALLLLTACGGERDISTDARTLQEAWDVLVSHVNEDDLLFSRYAAVSVDAEGRSRNYTLSAYAPAQSVMHVMQATSARIRFHTVPDPDAGTTAPIEQIRDTPLLLEEATRNAGSHCQQGLSLGIDLERGRAETICMSPRWAVTVSPYTDE